MKAAKLCPYVAAGMLLAGTASAQQWMGRVRVIDIEPDVTASLNGLDVKSAVVPELDFTYFVNKNIGIELILGTAKHDVTLNGAKLGTVRHIPPTLTAQYHFMPDGPFRPYAGVGLNYTIFRDVKLGGLDVDRSSFGPALQVGADIPVAPNLFLNLDLKKIWIKTDVTSGGAHVSDLKINPWVFGVGIGMKF